MAIEALVAVLLLITIGYCMLLNNRLKRLRSDEHSLKAVIAELITATEIAERAIGGLKHAVRDVNENLGDQLTSATEMSAQLKRQLSECDHVVRRLSKIAIAARPQNQGQNQAQNQAMVIEPEPARLPPPKPTGAKAVAAAAQAFSERRRTGGLAA
jgi:chromosome segregation ATPase